MKQDRAMGRAAFAPVRAPTREEIDAYNAAWEYSIEYRLNAPTRKICARGEAIHLQIEQEFEKKPKMFEPGKEIKSIGLPVRQDWPERTKPVGPPPARDGIHAEMTDEVPVQVPVSPRVVVPVTRKRLWDYADTKPLEAALR